MINENPIDFETSIADGSVIILDVRTPEEFNEGHIERALNIDIYGDEFGAKILELDPTKNYGVYCRSGKRSLDASNFMESNGFKDIHHLKDGILSWLADGKPVTEMRSDV
jgi:rhodanese-related sulfurtransferase